MTPDERDRRFAGSAVARWSEFPVHADPRPIVLLEDAARAEDGFATAEAKLAFLTGAIDASKGVPEEVIRLMGRAEVRARPARAALRIDSAAAAEAAFATDRGRKTLPAWRVVAADARGPIWLLTEEALTRCWSPPERSEDDNPGGAGPHVLSSAALGPGGRDLTVDIVGGSEALFDYDAEVVEETAAVAVIPRARLKKVLVGPTAISAEGHPRGIRAHLSEPLGSRVLVNLDATPVEVQDSSTVGETASRERKDPWLGQLPIADVRNVQAIPERCWLRSLP